MPMAAPVPMMVTPAPMAAPPTPMPPAPAPVMAVAVMSVMMTVMSPAHLLRREPIGLVLRTDRALDVLIPG